MFRQLGRFFDDKRLDEITKDLALEWRTARVVSVTEPIEADPNGKLMETILAGFAQFDNDVRAMRTVQGMRRKIQEGIFPWKPPLGYLSPSTRGEKKKEPDRPDNPLFGLLQKAWREFATGAYTKADIRRLLANWGMLTRRGRPISAQTLDNVFRNRYYAGVLVDPWSGEEHEGQHVPMVTPEEFAHVQRLIGRRQRSLPHQTTRPEFPLRGHVRCNACRRYLTGAFSRGRSRRYPYYWCYAKSCASRRKIHPAHTVHDEFEGFLDAVTLKPELRPALGDAVLHAAEERQAFAQSQSVRIDKQLVRIKRETQELIRLRTQGLITDEEFLAQKAVLGKRRTALESTPATIDLSRDEVRKRLTEIMEPLSRLRETWRALPDALRARFVRLVLPVGFLHGQVRTAERGRLFDVFGQFEDGDSNGVPLVRNNLNQLWAEIQGFADLFREWRGCEGVAATAVPTHSGD